MDETMAVLNQARELALMAATEAASRTGQAQANRLTLQAFRVRFPDFRKIPYPAEAPGATETQTPRMRDYRAGDPIQVYTRPEGITDITIRLPADLLPYLTLEAAEDGAVLIKWAQVDGPPPAGGF